MSFLKIRLSNAVPFPDIQEDHFVATMIFFVCKTLVYLNFMARRKMHKIKFLRMTDFFGIHISSYEYSMFTIP